MDGSSAALSLVRPDSLGDTLDAINAVLFYQQTVNIAERFEAASWIAERQGLPRSYAGMFAPTAYDYTFGALTFTGEPVVSGAGAAHLLSEEACRALYHLGGAESGGEFALISTALRRARVAILRRLETSEPEGIWSGVYCCATCSVALWRHLGSSGQPEDHRRLEHGLYQLKRHRDGKGRWKQYPFYYTLLALSELDFDLVHNELAYSLPAIERALRRVERSDPADESEYERRRRVLMGHILEKL